MDDENASIMVLTHILSSEYTVYAAKNGQDAIEAAEKYLPDVILLDIIMPKMDGYTVLRALKSSEKTQNIPVIFVTGLSDVDGEETGLTLGASDYITKPFSSVIVKLRVQNQIKILNQMRLLLEKELAEKSSRTRIEFLSNMSHEMLTPMNAIMGMTQIAKMSRASGKTKECLDGIEAASNHLLGLINDLLDMSGNKAGAFTLVDDAFSFRTMLRGVLNDIGFEAEEKQQMLSFDVDQSIPTLIIGDKERLGQVITNLLTNAVKFTPEHGEINLSAFVLNMDKRIMTLQIEITDNGIGISKEQQSKIFSIFERGDVSKTSKQGGVGLGLSISKRIIEKMGGKIWVESQPAKGSKFIFTCKVLTR